jgi:hypothetical protein
MEGWMDVLRSSAFPPLSLPSILPWLGRLSFPKWLRTVAMSVLWGPKQEEEEGGPIFGAFFGGGSSSSSYISLSLSHSLPPPPPSDLMHHYRHLLVLSTICFSTFLDMFSSPYSFSQARVMGRRMQNTKSTCFSQEIRDNKAVEEGTTPLPPGFSSLSLSLPHVYSSSFLLRLSELFCPSCKTVFFSVSVLRSPFRPSFPASLLLLFLPLGSFQPVIKSQTHLYAALTKVTPPSHPFPPLTCRYGGGHQGHQGHGGQGYGGYGGHPQQHQGYGGYGAPAYGSMPGYGAPAQAGYGYPGRTYSTAAMLHA